MLELQYLYVCFIFFYLYSWYCRKLAPYNLLISVMHVVCFVFVVCNVQTLLLFG